MTLKVDDKFLELLVNVRDISGEKLVLSPGEVLFVKIKIQQGGKEETAASLAPFQDYLQGMFPNNKVVLLYMGPNDDIRFQVAPGIEKV